MPEQGRQAVFEKALYVTSFLGGITFAALILLLQSSTSFTLPSWAPSALNPIYRQTLVTGTAIVSILFIAASIILIKPAGGDKPEKEPHYTSELENGGFVGLLILLPLLLIPFTIVGVIVLALVEILIVRIVYFE